MKRGSDRAPQVLSQATRNASEVNVLQDDITSALTGIELLPPEVISLILLKLDNLPSVDRLQALRVCKRWRAAALSEPRLWKFLDFSRFSKVKDADVLRILPRARGGVRLCSFQGCSLLTDAALHGLHASALLEYLHAGAAGFSGRALVTLLAQLKVAKAQPQPAAATASLLSSSSELLAMAALEREFLRVQCRSLYSEEGALVAEERAPSQARSSLGHDRFRSRRRGRVFGSRHLEGAGGHNWRAQASQDGAGQARPGLQPEGGEAQRAAAAAAAAASGEHDEPVSPAQGSDPHRPRGGGGGGGPVGEAGEVRGGGGERGEGAGADVLRVVVGALGGSFRGVGVGLASPSSLAALSASLRFEAGDPQPAGGGALSRQKAKGSRWSIRGLLLSAKDDADDDNPHRRQMDLLQQQLELGARVQTDEEDTSYMFASDGEEELGEDRAGESEADGEGEGEEEEEAEGAGVSGRTRAASEGGRPAVSGTGGDEQPDSGGSRPPLAVDEGTVDLGCSAGADHKEEEQARSRYHLKGKAASQEASPSGDASDSNKQEGPIDAEAAHSSPQLPSHHHLDRRWQRAGVAGPSRCGCSGSSSRPPPARAAAWNEGTVDAHAEEEEEEEDTFRGSSLYEAILVQQQQEAATSLRKGKPTVVHAMQRLWLEGSKHVDAHALELMWPLVAWLDSGVCQDCHQVRIVHQCLECDGAFCSSCRESAQCTECKTISCRRTPCSQPASCATCEKHYCNNCRPVWECEKCCTSYCEEHLQLTQFCGFGLFYCEKCAAGIRRKSPIWSCIGCA